ncbi:IclR family transcriptional regulator [Priestia megaterium]|uniref:IclR family transcriptional regulator n=1 Tax=Priestia megaterium TaxID=1404 RepID=UPI0036DC0F53
MEKNNNIKNHQIIKQENPSVQAVDRAIILLKLIADSSNPISINELIEKTNLNRTTVWRLVGTLENHDLVERDPITKGYQIGYATVRMANLAPQYHSLVRRSRWIMEKLRDESQETVLLSVPKHFATLTIEQIDPNHSIRLVDYVNAYLPLHCTSNGKMLLSYFSKEELDIFLKKPLEKVTTLTITDPNKLREEIKDIKENGISFCLGELDENENGICAPIIDKKQNLVGFLNVCGPSFRFTEEKMSAIKNRLVEACKRISENLD